MESVNLGSEESTSSSSSTDVHQNTLISFIARLVPESIRHRFFRRSLETNSGSIIIKDMITEYLRSDKAVRHLTNVIFVIGTCIALLMVWYIHGYLTLDKGDLITFHNHKGEDVVEYVPGVRYSPLDSLEILHLLNLKPFQKVKLDEITIGHIDTTEYHLGLMPVPSDKGGDWVTTVDPSKTLDYGRRAVVSLKKLNETLVRVCDEIETCECISAPHLRIPIRIVYMKTIGMMINPKVEVLKTIPFNENYNSPMGVKLLKDIAISARVTYYKYADLPPNDIEHRLSRAVLTKTEAACIETAVKEFGDVDEHSIGSSQRDL